MSVRPAPARRSSPCLALAVLVLLALPAMAAAMPRTAAASNHESYVIKSDGTLWSWGGNAFGGLGTGRLVPRELPAQVGSDATWKSITSGSSLRHRGAPQNGSLWHWGDHGFPFTTTSTSTRRRSVGRPLGHPSPQATCTFC